MKVYIRDFTPAWLIQQRIAFDLTQSGLARISGVSQSMISLYEAGKFPISLERAQKIAIALEQYERERECINNSAA